jgi:small conductance mechanosensitive channel
LDRTIIHELWDAADYAGRFFLEFLIYLAGVMVFVVVIAVTMWLGGLARRWLLQRAEERWSNNANLPSLVDNVSRLAIFVAGLVLALGVVGASTDSLVTWIGIIVAALSIAMQDVIKNLVAGFYLLIEQRFGAGDRIVVAGEVGVIESVDLRVTAIRNSKRQLVLVPNYLVFSQIMTTRTAREPYCLVLNVSEIEAEPETVRQSLLDVIDATLGSGASTPGIDLESIQSGRVSITARIFLDERATMREQVILAIHERFPGAGIVVAEG